jgi:hypothetical protein
MPMDTPDPYASLGPEDARRRMVKSFRDNDARPLFSGTAVSPLSKLQD